MASIATSIYTINNNGAQVKGRIDGLQYAGSDARYSFTWNLKIWNASTEKWDLLDQFTGFDSAGGSSGTGYAIHTFTNLIIKLNN